MRHRKSGTRLNMSSSHRKAMFRNMVTSLFKYDRIKTTDTRAKELRGWADHIITLAKRGDLHARRQALAIVREKDVVHKLFEEAEKRFGKVNGGYTRITKIGRRPGDAALISVIELISSEVKPKKKKAKAAPKKEAAVEKEVSKAEGASEEKDAVADAPEETQAAETAKAQPDTAETEASEEDATETEASEEDAADADQPSEEADDKKTD